MFTARVFSRQEGQTSNTNLLCMEEKNVFKKMMMMMMMMMMKWNTARRLK